MRVGNWSFNFLYKSLVLLNCRPSEGWDQVLALEEKILVKDFCSLRTKILQLNYFDKYFRTGSQPPLGRRFWHKVSYVSFGIIILSASPLLSLINPFSTKRPAPLRAKASSSLLKDFEFIGVVRSGAVWCAVVKWQDKVKTLQVGNKIGSVRIVGIDGTSIKILCENKEFVLIIKDE